MWWSKGAWARRPRWLSYPPFLLTTSQKALLVAAATSQKALQLLHTQGSLGGSHAPGTLKPSQNPRSRQIPGTRVHVTILKRSPGVTSKL